MPGQGLETAESSGGQELFAWDDGNVMSPVPSPGPDQGDKEPL